MARTSTVTCITRPVAALLAAYMAQFNCGVMLRHCGRDIGFGLTPLGIPQSSWSFYIRKTTLATIRAEMGIGNGYIHGPAYWPVSSRSIIEYAATCDIIGRYHTWIKMEVTQLVTT